MFPMGVEEAGKGTFLNTPEYSVFLNKPSNQGKLKLNLLGYYQSLNDLWKYPILAHSSHPPLTWEKN